MSNTLNHSFYTLTTTAHNLRNLKERLNITALGYTSSLIKHRAAWDLLYRTAKSRWPLGQTRVPSPSRRVTLPGSRRELLLETLTWSIHLYSPIQSVWDWSQRILLTSYVVLIDRTLHVGSVTPLMCPTSLTMNINGHTGLYNELQKTKLEILPQIVSQRFCKLLHVVLALHTL